MIATATKAYIKIVAARMYPSRPHLRWLAVRTTVQDSGDLRETSQRAYTLADIHITRRAPC